MFKSLILALALTIAPVHGSDTKLVPKPGSVKSGGGGGSGTVTSVALTVPSFLQVSGSPITTSGTLAVTLANESANLVFAGPSSGGAAAPTFRSLVAGDIPSLNYATIALDNLASVAINTSLAFDGLTSEGTILTPAGSGADAQDIGLRAGDGAVGFLAGDINVVPGSGDMPGTLWLKGGNNTTTSPAGDIILQPGTNSAGKSGSAIVYLTQNQKFWIHGAFLTFQDVSLQPVSIATDLSNTGDPSNDIALRSGQGIGSDTGKVTLSSGDATGGNTTGNIILNIGATSGTRGKIKLVDGSEGTIGDVWTSTDTDGTGGWATPTSGVPSPLQIGGSYSASSPRYSFGDDTNTGWDDAGNDTLYAVIAGGAKFYLNASEIGTTINGSGNIGHPSVRFNIGYINSIDTKGFTLERTITAGGTTGAQTINLMAGTVNAAAAATSIAVTDSLVDASSIVLAITRTNDTTCYVKNVVPGSGTFTINFVGACAAETSFGFVVTN